MFIIECGVRIARTTFSDRWLMRSSLLLAVVLPSVVFAEQSLAANISSFKNKDNREVIKLEGEIAEGDTERLIKIIRDVNQAGQLVSGIRLNSSGGNLLEGAKIADAIRVGRIVTVISNGSICASACFLAFAAGSEKFASYSSRVGVHGASDATGNETAEFRGSNGRHGARRESLGRSCPNNRQNGCYTSV